jgi:methionyl-tRNA formyltransferase
MGDPWRLVFMGTPDFAGPSLTALAGSGDPVLEVICQPDRPQGRGRQVAAPPVKTLALDLGLPVRQPESVRDPLVAERLIELSPDLLVVVAFGQLLPRRLLNIPRVGVLNVHPSLLPAHRGPAPINWAIIKGETETGVTTMFLDEGVDTGPILLARKVAIEDFETAGQLHDRLAVLGAELLLETIRGLKSHAVRPRPQPSAGAGRGRLLRKEDGLVDWTRPARVLACQVRGMDPWPGAYTTFKGKNLKLFGARPDLGLGRPGQVLGLDGDRLLVAAGEGSLSVSELQLAGKKRQTAFDFWHGQRLSRNDCFGP